ncbi:PH domain leucine-rich repeat-containing phosphatase 2 isoform X1 [Pelobates cultripes]|uniref:PH domain leucine-rich repeat-containing protein phosphatase 2 n=1 Tax=Pelobates cultripes TaxID=61616 RepID=A0AAD1TFI2_PELCU|nr:PH domain leucine-rich repeat-containing phosphatase 2 isoform X1 [Pelobates cultripes]
MDGHTPGQPGEGGPEPPPPRAAGIRVLKRNMKRSGSRNCLSQKSCLGSREREWLREDPNRGCVYVYAADQASSVPDLHVVLCTVDTSALEICASEGKEGLYVQLNGDLVRKLDPQERPLHMIYTYLADLGFQDASRIQEEAAYSDLSCMIRFYSEKPSPLEQLDRILLSGVFNVRKGKTQLHKWSERLVVLCGTCLIVSSVKECQTGKMHILPLVGGKIEEVKRRPLCLAFCSAEAQAPTYHISFDSPADYQRWHRQATKVVSQRLSTVDLSCQSLEEVPEHLFYCQDITSLNLRHNFMQLESPGGVNSLCRFSQLRVLNLSHNKLGEFPLQICEIPNLTELNLSCNRLSQLPAQIGQLLSLQTMILDGNSLTSLPEELGCLQHLSTLGLSFNDFSNIPKVYEKLCSVEKLCMAGNCVGMLSLQMLNNMPHLKHIDLRMNLLRQVMGGSMECIKHITYFDVRDNRLTELDLSCLGSLEQIHCERNQLKELKLCGFSLRAIYANSNRLTSMTVFVAPALLASADLSRNCLASVPEWVCESKKLEALDLSWNLLTEVPLRLMCSQSLRKLAVGHNQLKSLPNPVENISLDTLDVQHNSLSHLPDALFSMALNLRFLNASANFLETLPSASYEEDTISQLQVLYLTNNQLTDQYVPVLTEHLNLRILHLAFNQLDTFPASKLHKLEELEELNLSGNRLRTIPSTVSNCKRLHTLSAHSNCITVFPEIFNLPHIQLVDLSCNSLTEILPPETLPPALHELDLKGNRDLALTHQLLDIFSHISILKIDHKLFPNADLAAPNTPWRHGLTEMSGQRNKLCISSLAVGDFAGGVEALYGMFDGDRNEEVPRLLQCTMGDVLLEEMQQSSSDRTFMCHTFLVSHRKLGMAGQKLGSSALLCYIGHGAADHNSGFSLTVANVGSCKAVLCRNGQPLSLSRVFCLEHCPEDLLKIKEQKAIITEDNKVNGVTCCTRMLGCTYLHPWVRPRPHVTTVALSVQDELLILGNKSLWEYVSPEEAVKAIRHLPDTLAAAKKLCTLAQSYGCPDNVAALVVFLNVGEDACTCEMHTLTLPNPPGSNSTKESPDSATPSSSSGIASEFSSEMSVSEVSSEVGSTASDEHAMAGLDCGVIPRTERRCSLHPIPSAGTFQRQPSCATFSSNQSDNGLDSDDELQAEGIITNGSRVEVEVDIHCSRQQTPEVPCTSTVHGPEDDSGGIFVQILQQNSLNHKSSSLLSQEKDDMPPTMSGSCMYRKKHSNGSVVPLEEILNLIEVASEAPKRKTGYFSAPSQMDPDDQFVVPPQLQHEVREQLGEVELAAQDKISGHEEFDTAL